jgi:hypothetical protein
MNTTAPSTASPYAREPEDNSLYLKIEPNSEVKIRIASSFLHFYEDFKGNVNERFAWVVIHKFVQNGAPMKKVKAFKASAPLYKLIRNLAMNEDWGDPTGYDLTVKREGAGQDTTYTVTPSPKKELSDEDKKLVEAANVDLGKAFAKNMVAGPPEARDGDYDPFSDD